MSRGLAILLAAVALMAPASADAAPVIGATVDLSPEKPGSLVLGPDGNVWVLLDGGVAKDLARVTPGGTVTTFDLPAAGVDITTGRGLVAGPDDRLWISHDGGVTEVAPATGVATDHAIATINGARGIASDSEGDLWVVDLDGLVEVGPDGVKKRDVAVLGSAGREIARLNGSAAPSVVWTDFNGSVMTTTTSGVATTVPTALDPPGGPQGVAASPTGFAVANPGADPQYAGAADPTFVKAPTPGKDPFGVAFGADGAYWFAQFAGNDLGRLEPGGAYSAPVTFPPGSGPRQITAGIGPTLWVSLETSGSVARVDSVAAPVSPSLPPPLTVSATPGTPATPAAPRDTAAPLIARLSASRSRFRVSGSRSGTRFSLRTSEAGRATFSFVRLAGGRRSGARCVKPSRRLRRARACVRRVPAGALTRALPAGVSSVRFTGRVGGRRLAPGHYALTVRVTDAAGNRSRARELRLVVVRR